MSRVTTLEQIMMAAQPKREFDFDKLSTIPIGCLLSSQDIAELIGIATSIRYNASIHRKYEAMDAVMGRRGFVKAHSGTNRRIYRFLEDPSFVAKVAVDKVGMQDSPQEYVHQIKFQPFCCKIFEVHPSGIVAFVEKVNPITSLEEMLSVADDVFNMMITKIVGKYVIDDLGTKTFMNFGVRPFFGPVILDFPYVYELDPDRLICRHKIIDPFGKEVVCNGEIDIIPGFNGYRCLKCGREYKAIDLGKTRATQFNPYKWDDGKMSSNLRRIVAHFRSKVVDISTGEVVLDSGRRSDLYLTNEECDPNMSYELPAGTVEVANVTHTRHIPAHEMRAQYYSELQRKAIEQQIAMKQPTIGDLMKSEKDEVLEVAKVIKSPPFDPRKYDVPRPPYDDFEYTEGSKVQEAIVTGGLDDEDVIISREAQNAASGIAQIIDNAIARNRQKREESEQRALQKTYKIVPAPDQMPAQVYTDDQVQAMADEVAARNEVIEDGSSGDAAVLDPKQDKAHPEISPMTRPYVNANEAVYVGAMVESKHKVVETPKVIISSQTPQSESKDEEIKETSPKSDDQLKVPLEVLMPESEKAYRKADYDRRHKNDKRRTAYDEDNEE